MYRDYDARSYISQGYILVWEHTAAVSIKQIRALFLAFINIHTLITWIKQQRPTTFSQCLVQCFVHAKTFFIFFIFLGKFIFLKMGILLLCSVTLTGPRTPIEWIKAIHVHISGLRLCLGTAATNGPIVHLPGVTYENTEPWRNDTDRGKPKSLEKNRSQCQSVRHKSHMD
jgi:hypothetical protein